MSIVMQHNTAIPCTRLTVIPVFTDQKLISQELRSNTGTFQGRFLSVQTRETSTSVPLMICAINSLMSSSGRNQQIAS